MSVQTESRQRHIEFALKPVRRVSGEEELWEREWRTVEIAANALGTSFSRGNRVLDLGCGAREMEAGALRRGLDYVGLDIEDGNLDHEPVRQPDHSFDLALGLALIEHLHSPDHLMRELRRLLKPGGILFLTTPNWWFSWRTFFDNPAHVQPYSPKSLASVARAYGLSRFEIWPGLRDKSLWWYRNPWSFRIARFLPFRGRPSGVPKVLTGRSTSIILLGTWGFEELEGQDL